MKIAIIMRGAPGSGKSTFIKELQSLKIPLAVYSTDNFWYDKDGNYNFDINKLHIAHRWNYNKFINGIIKKQEIIVCDNTNIKRKEYLKYLSIAKHNHYKTVSVTFVPQSIELHVKRNIHGAPEDTIRHMISALLQNINVPEADIEIIGKDYKVMVEKFLEEMRHDFRRTI